jgi:hypothetical protein
MISGIAWAQEGPAYIGLEKAQEKAYTVSQKHGKNVLTLQTDSSIFYDKNGFIVEKYHLQGNLTYKGKTIINRQQDSSTIETLQYNHMNLLSGRKVEYLDALYGESTKIEYDAKGKILSKTSTRTHSMSADLWDLQYNQVGYVASYFQVTKGAGNKVLEKKLFDYKDDLQETLFYSYDEADQLTSILALSPSDSVVFKMLYSYEDENLVEEQKLDGMDQILESITYAYDANNRLIQRSEFYWNPRFGRIPNLRRQFDYSYE